MQQHRILELRSRETEAHNEAENRLRHSDEVFRLLVESVTDSAIFLLDPAGIVSTWNQGAKRIKGYEAHEIVGQHFRKFYLREAQESRWPERELELAAKEGRFADEGLRVRKDGSTFWANVVITALRNQQGELQGFSKVTRDLTERRALEERGRQLNKELRARVTELTESQRLVELRTFELQKLSAELLRVQDEERRRMARALHDDLGQELTALKIELDVLNTSTGASTRDLAQALELAESALSKVRNMSYLLHPPLLDESGLLPALHWYLEGLKTRGPLKISFDYQPVVFPRLPRELEIAIFRVIQESLTNIYRHSGSEDARIEIRQESDRVKVRIRDFGKGVPERVGMGLNSGVGISGMKERVKQLQGDLTVSRAEPGTLVEASIPILDVG
ncbi:MAG TPA: PAS domain S-box protein [Terriglobales bacterium]|nr:PAS domain S-box protein [Terriglobales bacterium]